MTRKLQLPLTSASVVKLLSFSPPSPSGFSQIQNVQRGTLNTLEKDLPPDSQCCNNSVRKGVHEKAGDPTAAGSGDSLGVPTESLLPALEHRGLPGSLLPAPITGDYSPGWPTELGHLHVTVVLVSACKWLLMDSPAPFFFAKSSFLKIEHGSQLRAHLRSSACLSRKVGSGLRGEASLLSLGWMAVVLAEACWAPL